MFRKNIYSLHFLLFLAIIILHFFSISQGIIEGVVLENKKPISGAHVSFSNCNKKTVTDNNGKFSLYACNHKVILNVSSVGFEKYIDTIHAHGKTFLSLNLEVKKHTLDDVVITGNYEKVKKVNSTVLVHITDAKELEKVGANTLSDGIGFQSGLRLENNCQNCGFSQVRINGLDGAYSQILINGKSAFSSLNNIYGLDQIPVELIEKIEVIKGGGSAIYGSNAIGGTINILTKFPVYSGFQVNTSFEALGIEKLNYSVGLTGTYRSKNSKFGLIGVFTNKKRLEYDANGDGFSEIPRLHNYAGNLKFLFQPSIQHKFISEVRILNEYRRGGDRILELPHLANIAEQLKSQVYSGDIDYQFISKNKLNKINVFGFIQKTLMNNYYGANMDINGYGLTQDLSWNFGIRYNKKFKKFLIGRANITTGIEVRNSFLKDEKPGYDVKINQDYFLFGGFTELNWKIHKKFVFVSGIRIDYQNITKKIAALPRFILHYKPIKGMNLRVSYARGFRAPQVFSEDVHAELVSGEIKRIQLSKKLKSEFSNSLNLSISYTLNKNDQKIYFSVDGFYNQISNPFVLEFLKEPNLEGIILEKRNGTQLSVYGLNLDFNYSWKEQLIFEAGITIQKGEYLKEIEWTKNQFTSELLKTPNVYGNYQLSYQPIKSIIISTFGRISGKMFVPHFAGYIDNDKLETSPIYSDLGLKIDYTFSFNKGYKLTLGTYIKNILNSYQKDFDFGINRDASYLHGPTLPRTIGISLKIGNL